MNIVFDIDGVLADNRHRLVHIENVSRKDWDAYYRNILDDKPILEMVAILKLMGQAGHCCILCTGRRESFRGDTSGWLSSFGLMYHVTKMFMRPDLDFRPNNLTKHDLACDIIKQFGPIDMVFEDDERSVAVWRKFASIVNHVGYGNRV